MKITKGLSLTVEEAKTVFNPQLFILYSFYRFSDDKDSSIYQLIGIEEDSLTFLVRGQSVDGNITTYNVITSLCKSSYMLNNCNIELIPFNDVVDLIKSRQVV